MKNDNTKISHPSQKSSVLFLAHGSPMNAIEKNSFTRALSEINSLCSKPAAILCISAHWLTKGTYVTHMTKPKTIHDFSGFPVSLYQTQYPAPGSPEVAEKIQSIVDIKIHLDDDQWGLDHGTWAILRHIYPEANIPVVQLSIDIEQPPEYHYQLGKKLRSLREDGILIIGSGNVVHNLKKIKWEANAQPYDWALTFDQWVKENLIKKNHSSLIHEFHQTEFGKMSIPTNEHYYPLLYTLGASEEADQISFVYEGIQNGSISMQSVSFDR